MTSYFLSRPSAHAGSKDSCHMQEMAQYCACGLGFDLRFLTRLVDFSPL